MNKSIVLLIVASLLLAGCTEMTESEDGETMKIEVNEDVAIEKIDDFMTVDEGESFGITMMYDMDPSMMGMDEGMLEVDEDSEAVITIEMTEAWSPDGYHSSSIMGISDANSSMKFVTSMTHIGTTMYVEMGYETQGDLCADEETQEDKEMCEMMFGEMPDVQSYSMTTTTTHTEVIAAMAEETESNGDDMDPMAMLEFFTFVECYGSFTPVDSVDGLQIFDITMEGMDDDSISPSMALCMADTDDNGGISFEEFMVIDETSQEDMDAMQTAFDNSDTNSDDELTIDELEAFITAVDSYYEDEDDHDHDHDDMGDEHDDDESSGMPNMAVAFNSAGEIEYFEMALDEMGEELTMMKIYVLTEERVNSLFSNPASGELVALPFEISDYMPYDGEDEEFMCDDGETIPMDWVNDGMDDCEGGEDEYDMGGSDEEFMCDDGETIPMDWVNDGEEDCNGGEDEDDMGEGDVEMFYMCDRFMDLATYESSNDSFDELYSDSFDSSICGTTASEDAEADVDDSTPTMPTEFVIEECDSDDCDLTLIQVMDNSETGVQELYGTFEEDMPEDCDGDYDADTAMCTEYYGEIVGSDDDTISIVMSWGIMFQCADGSETIDLTWVNDGEEDCADGSDESSYDENGDDTMGFTCLDGTVIPLDYVLDDEDDCDGGEDEMPYMEMNFWFDYQYDATTGSGLIVYVEEDYDEEEFMCDDGETIPMNWVNDGEEDCADGSDESGDDDGHDHGDDDGHDHGDHGDDHDEIVFYVVNSMDFHFEGDMSDYKIELSSCDYDYDMETGEETSTCTTVMSVAMADAGMDSDIMFHDADSSGTISDGDMIHIGDVSEDWDEVRLYSISADAYSDENPMHNAPGFTGLVGMLALLGAAFIRRNE